MGNEIGTAADAGNAAGQPGQAAPARQPGEAAAGQTVGQPVSKFARYPQEVKDRALQLVDEKVPYREIAAQVSPHCSTVTIARWVKEREEKAEAARQLERFDRHRIALDKEEATREMQEAIRARGW